uniref:Uncharacterized protein n=1 Tax=viral metagenome TaxID=1070528 RepID=A0A6C0DQA4_9ZZZZ
MYGFIMLINNKIKRKKSWGILATFVNFCQPSGIFPVAKVAKIPLLRPTLP